MTVADVKKNFTDLIDRVAAQGVTVEVQRDNQVVARISPVVRTVPVRELNRILGALPALGEDAVAFAEDVDCIRREFPKESDPWAS